MICKIRKCWTADKITFKPKSSALKMTTPSSATVCKRSLLFPSLSFSCFQVFLLLFFLYSCLICKSLQNKLSLSQSSDDINTTILSLSQLFDIKTTFGFSFFEDDPRAPSVLFPLSTKNWGDSKRLKAVN